MRTQADRDEDLKIGRELERKDAELARLLAENERLKHQLAAAGCTLSTSVMIIKRLGSEADAALITNVADQVAETLGCVDQKVKPDAD